jgi:hypothetical protein
MIKETNTDICFTEDGDFLFKRNSLYLSKEDNNEILIDTIMRRLQSSSIDWASNKIIAANLDYYRGEKITSNLVNLIGNEILNTIIADNLVREEYVDIKANRLNPEQINYTIIVYAKQNADTNIVIGLMYDQRVNKIIPRYLNPRELAAWQD